MALILLRHTTPDVAPGICYGHTDLGVACSFPVEAETALANLPEVQTIATSPLLRCRVLAEFIGDRLDLQVEQDPRLMEMNFGTWEGRAWSDIPRPELDAWAKDFFHARPHRGESVAMVQTRTQAALQEWRARDEAALLVTHAGIIRTAAAKGQTADDFNTQIDFGAHFTLSAPSAG